jgi:hypothetical protein
MTCHPERKGPQTLFSFRGPRRQVFVCGVEFGGGESKDLRLHFGIYAPNFRDRTLASSPRLATLQFQNPTNTHPNGQPAQFLIGSFTHRVDKLTRWAGSLQMPTTLD